MAVFILPNLRELSRERVHMAIIKLPSSLQVILPLVCSICKVKLSLDKATAGLLDYNGRQAFACVSHLSEIEKLILGWADFSANERFKSLHQGRTPSDLTNGGQHAR